MFLLRCAFWLSIVYASMSWTPGMLASGDAGAPAARTGLIAAGGAPAETLVEMAKTRIALYCIQHTHGCLDDAARLTSLVTASNAIGDADAGALEITATIPLPVPDPRRHMRAGRDLRDAKPAHIP